MKVFTKILAFILLLVWGLITVVMVFSIFGVLLFVMFFEKEDEWFCGGQQLLKKVLE